MTGSEFVQASKHAAKLALSPLERVRRAFKKDDDDDDDGGPGPSAVAVVAAFMPTFRVVAMA